MQIMVGVHSRFDYNESPWWTNESFSAHISLSSLRSLTKTAVNSEIRKEIEENQKVRATIVLFPSCFLKAVASAGILIHLHRWDNGFKEETQSSQVFVPQFFTMILCSHVLKPMSKMKDSFLYIFLLVFFPFLCRNVCKCFCFVTKKEMNEVITANAVYTWLCSLFRSFPFCD